MGCASESCFVACRQGGGLCGDGVNSCCAGWRCTGGTCAACAHGGQSCTTTAECCSGTCQNGACVGGLGGVCVSQAGCSQGECRDGRCQCAVDQILCNSGCVSYTDPNNCRGCGNVCATGTGRVCTVNGCVCDPQSAFPDECNGACVNKSNDRTNCGFCFKTCPKLDQVCNNGVCGCPGGLTDCNGSCVDTRTSQSHCGDVQPRLPGGRRDVQRRHLRVRAGLHPLPGGELRESADRQVQLRRLRHGLPRQQDLQQRRLRLMSQAPISLHAARAHEASAKCDAPRWPENEVKARAVRREARATHC